MTEKSSERKGGAGGPKAQNAPPPEWAENQFGHRGDTAGAGEQPKRGIIMNRKFHELPAKWCCSGKDNKHDDECRYSDKNFAPQAPAPQESAPEPAKPMYSVTVTFEIGSHHGEWTGREIKMEPQSVILCESPSREYAELFYKRIVKAEGGIC